MRKRIQNTFAVCLCAAALVTGCGGKASSSSGNVKILFSVSQMDAFRQTLSDAAKQVAEENGASLEVVDAEGVIETQVDQIQKAAAEGYGAVLCAPVDVDTAVELKASAGDMPIIFCNSCPKDKNLTADKYMYAGSDEKTAGEYQAEYVLQALSSKDEINVAIFKGEAGHSGTTGRTKGIKQAFASCGKKINYVFDDFADWSDQKAMEQFEVFLRTGVAVDCVLCNNDTMALGIIEACRHAGIDPGSILILGVDATAEGCAAIQSGDMSFTVYQSATGQGRAAVEAALKLASGASAKEVEGISEDGKYIWVPFEKVDSSNVAQYMN